MQRTFTATLTVASALAASTALAGGYVAPIQDAPPIYVAKPAPAAKFTWTGPYVGLSVGATDLELKRRVQEDHPAVIIRHPGETKMVTIQHPAVKETVIIPAETKIETIPAVTKEIDHAAVTKDVTVPAVTKDVDKVIEHPAETVEKPIIGKLWIPTPKDKQFPGCHHGNDTCPVPVEGTGVWKEDGGWTGQWQHGEIGRETVVTREPWTETVKETVIIQTERTETVVVKEAWTETVIVTPERKELVVVKPARAETVVVKPARTEKKVITIREPWTEIVRAAYSSTMMQEIRDNANTYGLFAGYRHQMANKAVLGIEANASKGSGIGATFKGARHDFDMNTVSIEAQAGYAAGRFLPYAALGVASTDGDVGYMAAIGVDYAVTDRFIVGAKLTHTRYDDLRGWEAEANTIALRAGIKF